MDIGHFLIACLLGCLAPLSVWSAEPLLIRSQSGQFVVRGLPLGLPLVSSIATSEVSYVRLDPAVLTVSLERIKQSLLNELGLIDEWSGSINVLLHPVRQDNEPVRVTSIRFADKWCYRVELPEQVNKRRLLLATMRVLLMEIANRRAGPRLADIPPWLAEGMLAHLRATSLASLTLEPQTSIVRDGRKRDPLQRARECLRTNAPVTLDELNMPTEELRSGANEEIYECCAQLFVGELLHLKNGRACLREMLVTLPDYLNWQTAFLRAFQDHFPRLLDVDKWWSLNLVNLTGRDLFSLWPQAQSRDRLQEILVTSIQVRAQTNEMPVITEAKLQTIIAEWDYPKQAPLLREKLDHLQALRPRVAPELAGLVNDYRQALTLYLNEGERLGLELERRGPPPHPPKWLVKNTQKRLDDLDRQRELLRKSESTAPTPARF